MSGAAWMQLAFLLVPLAISTPLLGSYMAKVYRGGRAPADRFFLPIERFVYRLCRIDPQREQLSRSYVFSMLLLSLMGGLVTYLVPACAGQHGTVHGAHVFAGPAGSSCALQIAWCTSESRTSARELCTSPPPRLARKPQAEVAMTDALCAQLADALDRLPGRLRGHHQLLRFRCRVAY